MCMHRSPRASVACMQKSHDQLISVFFTALGKVQFPFATVEIADVCTHRARAIT